VKEALETKTKTTVKKESKNLIGSLMDSIQDETAGQQDELKIMRVNDVDLKAADVDD
jgi:hypothetical protein